MQNNAKQGAAQIFLLVLSIVLMVFTSVRTLNLIESTLPPDKQVLGYCALVAFDGGMVIWLVVFNYLAKGHIQRAIAATMIGVCMIGVIAAFVADTFMTASKQGVGGKIDPSTISIVLWVIVVVIALNILSAVLFVVNDPARKQEVAEASIKHMIEEEARRQTLADAQQLAADLAPILAQKYTHDLRAKYMASIVPTAKQLPAKRPAQLPTKTTVRPKGSSLPNGKVHGMRIAFSNEQPEPPVVEYGPGEDDYEMEVVERPRKQRPPQPTAEQVVEYYADEEEGNEEDEDTSFLAQDGPPIYHNGQQIG